jgi:hypothetical protein
VTVDRSRDSAAAFPKRGARQLLEAAAKAVFRFPTGEPS